MNAKTHVQTLDWGKAIEDSSPKFAESKLDFNSEQIFATQLLLNNSYALKTAKENPMSLKLALYNVAAIGLSLNPAQGLAYLVPRRIKSGEPARICLDISYRGLIAIGVEVGSICWAKSELVYEHDKFTYRGPAEKPEHLCDPFDDERGLLRGAYCIAELPNGGFLVETMSLKEMNKIRDRSEAYKHGSGPWIDWEEQMRLKTVVKRASKWWPAAQGNARLGTAIQVLNEESGEGLVFNNNHPKQVVQGELPPPPPAEKVSPKVLSLVSRLVDRAVEAGAFKACEEVMAQRIKDPCELSYAFNELKIAQQAQSLPKAS